MTLAAEPAVALASGPTGLEALSAIVREAAAHLLNPGWLILEHGSDQAPDVAQLLERHGFTGGAVLFRFRGQTLASRWEPFN